jgi:hypothetical protein
MSKSRPSPEYQKFEQLLDRLLSVPRTAVQARIKAYRARAAQRPNRPGRKRKTSG